MEYPAQGPREVWSSHPLRVWALLLLFAAASLELTAYTGLIASDDLGYSHYAGQIASGTYRLVHHHYALRYGLLLPVAAVYRLFGVHEWTTVVIPLAASILTPLLLAILCMQLAELRSAAIAALLMATFAVAIRYGSILVPEPVLLAALLAAAIAFVHAQKSRSAAWALLAGILFGLAYLIKEPGAFVAAAFAIFAVSRRDWRVFWPLAGGCALVVGGELIWYLLASGDPLFRFHAMAAHNASPQAVEANRNLGYRLWKQYPRMMLIPNMDFGLHSLTLLPLAGWAVLFWRSRYKLLLILWIVLPYAYLNFGTTSFSHFWALPTAPRYLLPIYPPLIILASITLATFWQRGFWQKRAISALLAIIASIGISCAIRTRHTGYRAPEVIRLKHIAASVRGSRERVCDFTGKERRIWRAAFTILASDELGCTTSPSAEIAPDSGGEPILRILPEPVVNADSNYEPDDSTG